MTPHIFSLRIIAILLALFSAQVLPNQCDSLPPPSITVKRFVESVRLNTTYSYKSLTQLGAKLTPPGNIVLGLTRGNATVKFDIKTSTYIDRSGRWECTSPKIVVFYGFSPMTVYVAKEFPEGSCAYNEIYQHELQHIETYQRHLVSIENDLTYTLNRRFGTGNPMRGAVGQTRTALKKEIDEQWMPYIKREIQRVESAQSLIDTPESYARVTESCNGEIYRLTRELTNAEKKAHVPRP